MTKNQKQKYDLEERTAKFGEYSVEFLKKVPKNELTRPILSQLVRCTTSVGANYCEADDAESSNDFAHKIGICKKESRESKYFFRILAKAIPELKDEIIVLWKEASELNLIFNTIYKKVKNKNRKK